MKPRILFLDHSAALGGAELYLLDIARSYRDSSGVLLFESGPFAKRLEAESIKVEVQPAPATLLGTTKESGLGLAVKVIPGLMRYVRQVASYARGFDLLYANSQKALIVGSLAGKMARRPVIWNLHDILTADHFSLINRRVAVTLGNRLTDRVLVNSQATRDAFTQNGGLCQKTEIVYNGFSPDRFTAIPAAEVARLRRELNLYGKPVIGLFSRLTPWKGQHVLLEAMRQLPGVHAILVGGALFQDDHKYERHLKELVEHWGLGDRVHFLGFRGDIPLLMNLVDIVVHTSTAPEPFGRIIAEGMLARKPVIAARAGGAAEIIEQGQTGFLTEPGNAKELAESIKWLLDRPRDVDALSQRGYESALSRFSLETMLARIDEQVRSVLNKHQYSA